MQHDGEQSKERIRGTDWQDRLLVNLENANNSFQKVFVVTAARASTFELLLKAALACHWTPLEFRCSFRRITLY